MEKTRPLFNWYIQKKDVYFTFKKEKISGIIISGDLYEFGSYTFITGVLCIKFSSKNMVVLTNNGTLELKNHDRFFSKDKMLDLLSELNVEKEKSKE